MTSPACLARPMVSVLVPVLLASALAACTGGGSEAGTADREAPVETTSPATPSPDVVDDVVAADAAAALRAATRDPLDASTLPAGFHYEDRVEIDDGTDAVSNIYGGPEGPTGPTIWLHTDIGPDYTTERQADLAWDEEAGFADGYSVRSAEGGDGFAFVDIDAEGAVGASVQLVARGVPLAELQGMARRLVPAGGA